MGGRRPALDGIRGVAILLVIAGHAGGLGIKHSAGVGVTLFFVLSGYLITGQLVRELEQGGRVDLRAFWSRRARRILPALGLFAAVPLFVFMLRGDPMAGLGYVALMPVMNYYEASGHEPALTQHLWSLASEEQFYLLWPLVLVGLWRIRRSRVVWVLALAFVCFSMWRIGLVATGRQGWAYYSLDGSVFAIVAGCLAAVARWRAPGRKLAWAGVAVLLITSLSVWSSDLAMTLRVPVAVAGVALVMAAEALPWLRWAPLRAAGGISYGWYLWHFPFMVLAGPSPVLRWATVPVSLALAVLSWRTIERPVLERWKAHRQTAADLIEGVPAAP